MKILPMRNIAAALLTLAFTTTSSYIHAQQDTSGNDLMALLSEDAPAQKVYTNATFKSSRIVSGHSIENVGAGTLDFRILHRFGELKDVKNFFGLDGANTALGFDYGITDWWMVGIFRSTYEKEFLGFTKFKILRQTEDDAMPISVSYMGNMSVQTMDAPTLSAGQEYHFSNRLFYVNQLLVARKFSNGFSAQLMPTHVHYNLVPTDSESNNTFAVGVGGRIKLSNRISLNAEYYFRVPGTELLGYQVAGGMRQYRNALLFGFDIETGGHVFQLTFSNAPGMSERVFIGQNTSDWATGQIHFGFNISRVFTIVKPKEFENSRNKIW